MNEFSPLPSLLNHCDYSRLHDHCNTPYNVRISADIASTQSTFPRDYCDLIVASPRPCTRITEC